MKININEINFTIEQVTDSNKHENLLAYVTLIFREESGAYLTISGFTLWRSKYGGFNVEVPSKPGFKYCLIEKSLWRKIKQEIIKQYDYGTIPIVEESEKD
jgi:hypothetical protein